MFEFSVLNPWIALYLPMILLIVLLGMYQQRFWDVLLCAIVLAGLSMAALYETFDAHTHIEAYGFLTFALLCLAIFAAMIRIQKGKPKEE